MPLLGLRMALHSSSPVKRVTMAEIADSLGLSRPTVSHALNGTSLSGKLRPETVQRIREAAEQMGYIVNDAARATKTGRARTIALFSPSMRWTTNYGTLHGASSVANAHGYQFKYIPLGEGKTAIADAVRTAQSQLVPGAICLNVSKPQLKTLSQMAADAGIVLGQVADSFPKLTALSVVADYDSGAEQMIEHLYSLGHRRLGFLINSKRFASSAARLIAFRRSMKRLGLKYSEEYVREGEFDPEQISVQTEALMRLKPRPTAIVCDSDPPALRVLNTLTHLGWRIPQDVSVTGFVNLPFGRFSMPTLTTVDIPSERMGQVVVEQMIAFLEKGTVPPEYTALPVSLIVRESTGPANG